jgi:hypothetical protein
LTILGSIIIGNLKTLKSDNEVKAMEGVKTTLETSVKDAKLTSATITGIEFIKKETTDR